MRMLLEIGREGQRDRRSIEWDGERPIVIGRSRETDVPISDPILSRRQCKVESDGDACYLLDLNSSNGTFINGVRIERSKLGPGDLVTFGSCWLRLSPLTEDATDATLGLGDPLETPPEISGYEITDTIGKGSFGIVYRATHRLLQRPVAIKCIRTVGPRSKPELVKRFLREIEAMGRLDHPNLVRVFGAGEGRGFAYLVMELVEGPTLSRAARTQPLEIEAAVRIARDVASALEHAFQRKLVHRDVKPENILLGADGRAKLCDFGLVKQLGAQAAEGLTRPGQGFGSVAYMPPEQVRTARKADQRADVYSLGATLYYALTTTRPFSGTVTAKLLHRVIHEDPTPIREIRPEVPSDVVAVVERCMRKDPAARFQTPHALRVSLDQCLHRLEGSDAATGSEPTLSEVEVAASAELRTQDLGVVPSAALPAAPRAGAASAPAGPRARQTAEGVPSFEAAPPAPGDSSGAIPPLWRPAGRTVVGVPSFDAADGEGSGAPPPLRRPAGRTVVGVPSFDGGGAGAASGAAPPSSGPESPETGPDEGFRSAQTEPVATYDPATDPGLEGGRSSSPEPRGVSRSARTEVARSVASFAPAPAQPVAPPTGAPPVLPGVAPPVASPWPFPPSHAPSARLAPPQSQLSAPSHVPPPSHGRAPGHVSAPSHVSPSHGPPPRRAYSPSHLPPPGHGPPPSAARAPGPAPAPSVPVLPRGPIPPVRLPGRSPAAGSAPQAAGPTAFSPGRAPTAPSPGTAGASSGPRSAHGAAPPPGAARSQPPPPTARPGRFTRVLRAIRRLFGRGGKT